MSAESGLPSMDPEVKDTVNEEEKVFRALLGSGTRRAPAYFARSVCVCVSQVIDL